MRSTKLLNLLLFSGITFAALIGVQPKAFAETGPQTQSAAPTRMDGVVIKQTSNPDLELMSDTEAAKLANEHINYVEKVYDKGNHFMQGVISKAKAAAENSTISGNVVNQNKTILDAFNLGVADTIAISPAYIGGHFLREDSYTLREFFSFFQFFFPVNYPANISASSQQEIDVWRVFRTYHDATHPRKFPILDFVAQDLPVNSQVLLKRMKPGTTVRFHVPLNLFFGASHYFPIGTTAYVQGSLGTVFSGEYDVYVFRGDHDRARIRLVANRDNQWQEIYKFGLGDRAFTRVIPTHILRNIIFSAFKLDDLAGAQVSAPEHKDIFLADYTLNLSYEKVRDAYDKLFAKALIFKDKKINSLIFKVAWPFTKLKKLRHTLISDLRGIEKIYEENLGQPNVDLRQVDRNFIGSNFANGHEVQGHFGISGIYKVSADTSLRENQLTVDRFDKNQKKVRDYYIFPEWFIHNTHAALLNIFREDLLRSAFMVYKANKYFDPVDFDVIGFNYDLYESRYGNPANQKVLRHFHHALPPVVFADLESFMAQNGLMDLAGIYRGVRVSARYYLNQNGLFDVEHRFYKMSSDEVFSAILNDLARVVRSSRHLAARPQYVRAIDAEKCQRVLAINRQATDDNAAKYCGNLVYIATQMTSIVNPGLPPAVREAGMDSLIHDNLFREIGPGLLYSVIPPEDYSNSVYVQLKFYLPKHVAPVAYYWPRGPDNKPIMNINLQLIEQILDNERMMNNETPDMRINGDKDTITTRKVRFDGDIQHGENQNPLQP